MMYLVITNDEKDDKKPMEKREERKINPVGIVQQLQLQKRFRTKLQLKVPKTVLKITLVFEYITGFALAISPEINLHQIRRWLDRNSRGITGCIKTTQFMQWSVEYICNVSLFFDTPTKPLCIQKYTIISSYVTAVSMFPYATTEFALYQLYILIYATRLQ